MATCVKLLPLLFTAACATPNMDETLISDSVYLARGQEPGWTVAIARDWIDYVGNYGDKKILVPRPEPRTTFNGHRYETQRLVVDVTHGRCNDVMSGHGYADTVSVIADGETYAGCGGERRTDWDN